MRRHGLVASSTSIAAWISTALMVVLLALVHVSAQAGASRPHTSVHKAPMKGSKKMKATQLTLKAGESGIVGDKLKISVLDIGSQSHSISDSRRSAPAMSATTVKVKVELGDESQTLSFLTAYAGFVTNETEEWNGYRIQLQQISYPGNTATAEFTVTPIK